MHDESRDLESKLEALADRLATLERRMNALEGVPEEWRGSGSSAEGAASDEGGIRPVAVTATLPLVGRVLVALAGAFLIRAITERGVLPEAAGTLLGLVYAVVWIALADWSTSRGNRTSATFHGVAAAVIAYPLVWEATVRFEFLSPLASALALAAVTLLGLLVAHRRSLRRLGWVFTVGATVTAVGLLVTLKMPVLFTSVLLLVGVATLWLGFLHGWRGPGWIAAIAVDAGALLTTAIVLIAHGPQVGDVVHPASVVALLLSMLVAYLGSFAAHVLGTQRDLETAELVQAGAALLLGLGGSLVVTHAAGLSGLQPGVVSLVGAVACYAVSFAFIDRALELRRNFMGFTTAALLFALVALEELLSGSGRVLGLSAVAMISAWLGTTRNRATLSLHAAVYAAAAAVASSLLPSALQELFAPVSGTRHEFGPIALVSLAVIAICAWFPAVTHGRTWSRRVSRAPRVLLLGLLALGVDGVLVGIMAPYLPGGPAGGIAPGAMAALRTAVLASSVLGLALLARRERFAEARWIVYPLLVLGGIKLVLEDVRSGNPSTIFVSLAFYGGALILVPRLLRRQTLAQS